MDLDAFVSQCVDDALACANRIYYREMPKTRQHALALAVADLALARKVYGSETVMDRASTLMLTVYRYADAGHRAAMEDTVRRWVHTLCRMLAVEVELRTYAEAIPTVGIGGMLQGIVGGVYAIDSARRRRAEAVAVAPECV